MTAMEAAQTASAAVGAAVGHGPMLGLTTKAKVDRKPGLTWAFVGGAAKGESNSRTRLGNQPKASLRHAEQKQRQVRSDQKSRHPYAKFDGNGRSCFRERWTVWP